MKIKSFGITDKKEEVFRYTFKNKNGMEITVSNFGAVLTNIIVPDKDGYHQDVVLGYSDLEGYALNTNTYFGATVGRNANRIANGRFEINGKHYQIPINEGCNNLHSGPNGYQIRTWNTEHIDEQQNSITFALDSPDGDQGFPGNLKLRVTYELTDSNRVCITYEGLSDTDTVFNPTNHSYFNLGGHESGSILSHRLTLYASKYTPVIDKASIPTGEFAEVAGTAMDFIKAKEIGQEIEAEFNQLQLTGGYDHNYVLDKGIGVMGKAAEVECEQSGIRMEVYTDLPGIQFYAGNFLNGELGKCGAKYEKRGGFCLETQHYPNSINTPSFHSPVIKAGEAVRTMTEYRFFCNWLQ